MQRYKGYIIWHNALREKCWLVQQGHTIVYSARTLGAAKRWITLYGSDES